MPIFQLIEPIIYIRLLCQIAQKYDRQFSSSGNILIKIRTQLPLQGQDQMSPKFNHFQQFRGSRTVAYQVTSIFGQQFSSFCAFDTLIHPDKPPGSHQKRKAYRNISVASLSIGAYSVLAKILKRRTSSLLQSLVLVRTTYYLQKILLLEKENFFPRLQPVQAMGDGLTECRW